MGASQLFAPLNGDTALFHLGAAELLDGAALYHDWWDLKGPGVYLVHAIAVGLFGTEAFGLHLLALLGMLAVAAGTYPLLRERLRSPQVGALGGLLCVAPYYLVATEWHQSQPAVFAGLALFGGYLGLLSPKRHVAVLGGLAFALAVSIKLSAFGPALAMLGLVLVLRDRGGPWVLAGFLGGLALMSAWLWQQGSWTAFWWTHTGWREAAAPNLVDAGSRFLNGAVWFARAHIGLILLAAVVPLVAARVGFKGGRLSHASKRWWQLGVVWLVFGVAGVGLERFAAWPFDMLLLSIPIGVVATAGLDALELRRWAPALALLVLLPSASGLMERMSGAADVSRSNMEATSARLDMEPAGTVYVFGDPRHLLASGRRMATSIHGWAWELQPPEMWERVEAELKAAPPRFVVLDDGYAALVEERNPSLAAWLRRTYRHGWDQPGDAAWHVRREPGPAIASVETPAL